MRPAPLFLMDWKGDPFVTYQTHSPEETRALGAGWQTSCGPAT